MVTGKNNKGSRGQYLQNVPEDKKFWLKDGQELRNLRDLKDVMEDMSFETFHYHVNPQKNDFAAWIHDVIGDKELARKVKRVKTRKTTLKHLNNRIKELEK